MSFEEELAEILRKGREAAQTFDADWRRVRQEIIYPLLQDAKAAFEKVLEGSKPEATLQNGGPVILKVAHGNYVYDLVFKPHHETLSIIRETNIKDYPPEVFTAFEHVKPDAVKQEIREFSAAISRGRPSLRPRWGAFPSSGDSDRE